MSISLMNITLRTKISTGWKLKGLLQKNETDAETEHVQYLMEQFPETQKSEEHQMLQLAKWLSGRPFHSRIYTWMYTFENKEYRLIQVVT